MERIRVLAVDDSVVIRRVLRESLSSDDQIELVGVASNGRVALAMIEQCKPDAITLDIEMPEMDGLETLLAIRARNPRIPVVMFSTLTERGAAASIEAFSRGASDYVTKPTDVRGVSEAAEQIKKQLIPKLKSLCGVSARSGGKPTAVSERIRVARRTVGTGASVEVVVIGSSTGGPNALGEVLPSLPADFPVPILIVQHMPPLFTRFLAERLNKICRISVREGVAGDLVSPGQAIIAPGDFHIGVAGIRGQVQLTTHKSAPENSCRPSVDVLFRSAAERYRAGVLAVVMTGMGQDGLRGSEVVHAAGGRILVQDEATSVVWGMPGFVASAGLADAVLPMHEIGAELVRSVTTDRHWGAPHGHRVV